MQNLFKLRIVQEGSQYRPAVVSIEENSKLYGLIVWTGNYYTTAEEAIAEAKKILNAKRPETQTFRLR